MMTTPTCRALCFIGLLLVSSPSHGDLITGTIPFLSVSQGPAPFMVFNNMLTVNGSDDLQFSVNYNNTTGLITQLDLTIGSSSVMLLPADLDAATAKVSVSLVGGTCTLGER